MGIYGAGGGLWGWRWFMGVQWGSVGLGVIYGAEGGGGKVFYGAGRGSMGIQWGSVGLRRIYGAGGGGGSYGVGGDMWGWVWGGGNGAVGDLWGSWVLWG